MFALVHESAVRYGKEFSFRKRFHVSTLVYSRSIRDIAARWRLLLDPHNAQLVGWDSLLNVPSSPLVVVIY